MRLYRLVRPSAGDAPAPPDWQPVYHARSASDPLTLETLDGIGVPETVFVERPATAAAFFRIQVESPGP